MSRRDRWASLSPGDRRLTLIALAWVTWAVVVLRLRPGADPLPWSRRAARGRWDPTAVDLAVRRAARVVPSARCLAMSLAAQAMLPPGASVTYSVRRSGSSGRIEAHAWVEFGGRRVAGDGPPAGSTVLERAS